MKRIEVIVHPSGKLEVDAVGYRGASCEQATAFLEQALGEVQRKQRKPEYQLRAVREQKQRVGK